MADRSLISIAGVLQSHLERRPVPPLPALARLSIVAKAQALVAACGVRMETGGTQPCYDPSSDIIYCPHPAFYWLLIIWKRPKRYAIDVCHELIHATGQRERLNRPRHEHWGDVIYAREELTAELGSALIMHDLGIKSRPRLPHAKYLKSWLQGLDNPTIELDLAMARANQAAGWVIAVASKNSAKRQRTFA
jgi:antirestriction protein ArdC